MIENSTAFLASLWRRFRGEMGLLIAILVVIAATAWLDPAHNYVKLPGQNATEILRQTSLLGIFALGATIVIVSGGIDLSTGSVMAFSGAFCASIILALAPMNARGMPILTNLPVWIWMVAIAGTVASSFVIGTFHTWLITVMRLPPFVATLASLVGLRSFARVMVQEVNKAVTGQSNTLIHVNDERFRMLGNVWWISLVIFLLLSVVFGILMSKTVTGRHLYAMGGNEHAARLSGIRTERLKWLAYCVSALTASIAGVLHMAYVGLSNPANAAMGYELNAIAASVIGGCSLTGGIGSITGTMLGALFLRTVIDSVAKTVKSNPDDFEGLIVGLLVVLAVAFNGLRRGTGFRWLPRRLRASEK